MTDTPWETALPPTSLPEAPPQPRQRRKKAEDKPPRQTRKAKEPEAEKPARKPREKTERAAPETVKVTLKEYAEMRVGTDAKAFIKMHGILAAVGKNSRAKLLDELSKVLG